MMLNGSRSGSLRVTSDADREALVRDEVMFIDDLVALLRVSRATIERRRRDGTFPIPELYRLDRRPRWSRRTVETYLASSGREIRRARGRPRSSLMR